MPSSHHDDIIQIARDAINGHLESLGFPAQGTDAVEVTYEVRPSLMKGIATLRILSAAEQKTFFEKAAEGETPNLGFLNQEKATAINKKFANSSNTAISTITNGQYQTIGELIEAIQLSTQHAMAEAVLNGIDFDSIIEQEQADKEEAKQLRHTSFKDGTFNEEEAHVTTAITESEINARASLPIVTHTFKAMRKHLQTLGVQDEHSNVTDHLTKDAIIYIIAKYHEITSANDTDRASLVAKLNDETVNEPKTDTSFMDDKFARELGEAYQTRQSTEGISFSDVAAALSLSEDELIRREEQLVAELEHMGKLAMVDYLEKTPGPYTESINNPNRTTGKQK